MNIYIEIIILMYLNWLFIKYGFFIIQTCLLFQLKLFIKIYSSIFKNPVLRKIDRIIFYGI